MAGLVAGAVGTWAMTRMQSGMSAASKAWQDEAEAEAEAHRPLSREQPSEPATAKAADMAMRTVGGRYLTEREKARVAPLVHYAFGTLMGGVYGLLAEVVPSVTTGGGTGFGTALFIGADEVAVPALGLSGTPGEMPASSHAFGLASHLGYGLVVELVRRNVRDVM
ncbi:MAG: DUF1440 domain-containing protein [Vicinamibacterales bacterium]